MGLFGRKKVPPMWYIMDEPKTERQTQRQGPYNRETFVQLLAEGRIESTQLVWTTERIFPNANKPRSARLVRIPEWRRLDEFPDVTLRKLKAEGAELLSGEAGKAGSYPAAQDDEPDEDDDEGAYGPPPGPPPYGQQGYPNAPTPAPHPHDPHYAQQGYNPPPQGHNPAPSYAPPPHGYPNGPGGAPPPVA